MKRVFKVDQYISNIELLVLHIERSLFTCFKALRLKLLPGHLPANYSRPMQLAQSGHTQSMLEDLHIPPDLGTTGDSPGGDSCCPLGKVSLRHFSFHQEPDK